MSEEKILPAAPSLPRKAYKRRMQNILIHKPMQREFSFILIALLMVSTCAVAFVIHSTVREIVFGGDGYHFGKVNVYEILSDLSYQLLVRVSAILLVTLFIIATFGVFFLHRVAGPVYRFRRTLMALNDGDIPNLVKLREGDFFTETAVEFNRLLKRLKFDQEKTKRIKEKLGQITTVDSKEVAQRLAQELKALLEQEYEEKEG